jgi:opacity protein-like surface antigen
MNIRMIALSGAALLALTISAAAQESGGATSGGATSSAPSAPPEQPAPQPTYTPPPPPPSPMPPAAEYIPGGWYMGLGAGWDALNNINFNDNLGNYGDLKTNDSALVIGSLGYRFPASPFRVELEGGYDWHKLNQLSYDGVSVAASGHANLGSALVNGIYDFQFAPRWALSIGGGVGAGFTNFNASTPVTLSSSKTDLMWQGIGGLSYSLAPNTDLFVDYRYRDAMSSGSVVGPSGNIIHVHDVTENVVLAGLRWYVSP